MKKTLLVILATLLLFTAACSGGTRTYPTDDTYHPENDDPSYNTSSQWYGQIVPTENGYYFLIENTLMYADADTMEPIQVCTKPNCTHNEETDSDRLKTSRENCEAFFSQGQLMYSNGVLYILYVADHFGSPTGGRVYTLARVSADGSKRRDILFLDDVSVTNSCIHRGRLYVTTEGYNQQATTSAQLWSYSLDNPREEPVLLYQTEEREMYGNPISVLRAYGNRLYIMEQLRNNDDRSGAVYALQIYDLTTGEWRKVELPEGYDLSNYIIYNGQLWCMCFPIGYTSRYKNGEERPEAAGIMVVYELDGSGGTQVDNDSLTAVNANEQYLYMRSPSYSEVQTDGSIITSISEDTLYFYDAQMNLVDELPFKAFERDGVKLRTCTIIPLWGDKTLVYAQYKAVAYGGWVLSYWYFDHDEIGTGNITPVRILEGTSGAFTYAYGGD